MYNRSPPLQLKKCNLASSIARLMIEKQKDLMRNRKTLLQYDEFTPCKGYPHILEGISENPINGKETVVSYLKGGKRILNDSFCMRYDIFTGKLIGVRKYYTDDEWEWTSELAYYFERYNIKLPDEFVNKILNDNAVSSHMN